MEQKGALTLVLLGVIFLSFLATSVTCRPKGNSSSTNSNNLKGQQYQHYDTHHHSTHHRLSNSNARSHHHSHHHSKRAHHHQQEDEQQHHQQNTRADDESNKISLLHRTHESEPATPAALTLPSVSGVRPSDSLTGELTRSARTTTTNLPSSRRLSEEDYDDYDEDDDEEDGEGGSGGGRHAYLMTTDKKKSSAEKITEDQALNQAFEKHMRPSGGTKLSAKEVHDVYAYQLPSDLWFVVRYSKNNDGQVEKYMNIVDSFTNYLDKLDKDVKTVSVNVKGVETVFRLTTKHNNSSS